MALISKSEALNLSASIFYRETAVTLGGDKAWLAWVKDKANTGPHAFVERRRTGTYRSRPIRCGSLGAYHAGWLGAFKTRKLAAHAALVA